MVKQDVSLQPHSGESQEMLAEAVQMAFHHLVRCLQGDLQRVMSAFLDPQDDADVNDGTSLWQTYLSACLPACLLIYWFTEWLYV